MEVQFTPEQEARIAQLATKTGTDAEHVVKDAVPRLLEQERPFLLPRPNCLSGISEFQPHCDVATSMMICANGR